MPSASPGVRRQGRIGGRRAAGVLVVEHLPTLTHAVVDDHKPCERGRPTPTNHRVEHESWLRSEVSCIRVILPRAVTRRVVA